MSLNAFLHPRNPYQKKPDFKELALKEPAFRAVVKQELSGKVTLDFSDREAVRVLTRTLLKHDFGLNVEIPTGSLVPTLPLRFNYLLWIEDLLKTNGISAAHDVIGFDIGAGASCIYPLLGVRHFNWRFIAAEANQESFDVARKNVEANGLADKIDLHLVHAHEVSNVFNALTDKVVSFTMCNPPFHDEMAKEVHDDPEPEHPPPGHHHEVKTKGGEIEFIHQVYEASKAVSDKVKVFTCMTGYKSSVGKVKKFMHEDGTKCSEMEFCQGKTLRWGVAWTFDPDITLELKSLLRKKKEEKKKHAPINFTLDQLGPDAPLGGPQRVLDHIKPWLAAADVLVKSEKVDEKVCSFTVKSHHQNWRNQRKKRREEKRIAEEKEKVESGEPPAKMAKVCRDDNGKEADGDDGMQVDEHEGPLQLCARLSFHLENGKEAVCSGMFIDGESGRNGLHELICYIKNKAKGL